MKRGGRPEEVAEAVVWLLSDQASYVTGSFIELAGGKVVAVPEGVVGQVEPASVGVTLGITTLSLTRTHSGGHRSGLLVVEGGSRYDVVIHSVADRKGRAIRRHP